ncbi:2-dehydropantoate 2-reductase [Terribacillus sp. DMT04]|uniref:2-dehydropantoate 2-reductase n=1 Tax=Terribacillus sp. DMT04 TaxID=2850441 RepID=UPI001C2BC148|nr:2-dehydropantoate 2-reductase [Terribacillus sp. DMT04]QXE02996.1 2-dehydropantoate 2-reductase [Terribacillus sp. DMT04]
MRITVIGAGAIGLLTAAKLSSIHEVQLLTRTNEQAKLISSKGICLDKETIHINAIPLDDLYTVQSTDLYIICTKQYDVKSVWDKLVSHAAAPVLFLQNGMAHTDMLLSSAFDYPIVVGSVEQGAMRVDSHRVRHTGKAGIRLANLTGNSAAMLVQRLHDPNFPFLLEKDWHRMLGRKLIANAVINPLTAIYRVKNGEILDCPAFCVIAEKLCEEAAEALGFHFAEQWAYVRQVIMTTKNNRSSMLKDIEAGRKTEVESISGYVKKHANRAVPYTDFVYYSIIGLTRQQERTSL